MSSTNRKVKVLETGKVYDSVEECAKAINGTPQGISAVLTGAARKHRGYTFSLAGKQTEPTSGKITANSIRLEELNMYFRSVSHAAEYLEIPSAPIHEALRTGFPTPREGYTFHRVTEDDV